MAKRKTWREKLADAKGLPKVARICGPMLRRWGDGTVAIPAPLDVDAIMKRVPRGKRFLVDGFESRLVKLP